MNSRLKARICGATAGILFVSFIVYGFLVVQYGYIELNLYVLMALLLSFFPFLLLAGHFGFKDQLEAGAQDPFISRPRLVAALRGALLGLAGLFAVVGIWLLFSIQDVWGLVIPSYFTVILVLFERDLAASRKKYLEVKPTGPYRDHLRKQTGWGFYLCVGIAAVLLLVIGVVFSELFWHTLAYSSALAVGAFIRYLYVRKKNSTETAPKE